MPLRMWLRDVFRRNRFERELEDELRFHLEMRIQRNIEAGMNPEDARRDALKRFGNLTSVEEDCRETRAFALGEDLLRDLRFGAKLLARSPGFTAVAALTIALGIGANTAIFSYVDAVLLKPFPYREPDRLVEVETVRNDGNPNSPLEFLAWQARNQVFSGMAGFTWGEDLNLTGDFAERVRGARVSANYFDVLGVPAALGRTFLPGEDEPGKDRVVGRTSLPGCCRPGSSTAARLPCGCRSSCARNN